MRMLPTGTATFLFTDIEGSTRLVEATGEAYGDLLAGHHELLRAAIRAHRGVEVGTEGDSFFVVFPDARDAVTAAVEIQRAIAGHPWPAEAKVRLRIGLHTGEARLGADTYVGMDVHRAARIMAAAHGGQILVSTATRDAVALAPLPDIGLRSLGEHRLRDLPTRERLYQVMATGLEADLPPPRSVESIPSNLPLPDSDILGRDAELATIHDRILTPSVRILTLVGPGGIGKTRLAVHAAATEIEHFGDGAHFVDLSPARDSDDVHQAVVRSVELTVTTDGRSLGEAIAEQLRPRELLLVLDNFEQVMPVAPDIADLIRRCPRLKVLVTSREPLRVRPEEVLAVQPLALPTRARGTVRATDIAGAAAVRLFVERARLAQPGFELTDANAAAVADICARLDGLPLAIELAAARLRLFSAEELRDRLGSRLDVLKGGARDLPDRQRTLRDAIAWSHDLLDDDERAVFRIVSVFETARVGAVEGVMSRLPAPGVGDIVSALGSLIDKSLLRSVDEGTGPRLSMLETIREYAVQQLEGRPEIAAAARGAHAEWFADLAGEAAPALTGPGRSATLDELAGELGNLLAAWAHHLEARDIGRVNQMLDALWALHDARGWYHGAIGLSNDLLGALAEAEPSEGTVDEAIALRLSLARGLLALQGYTEQVEQLYHQALEQAARSGGLPHRFAVLRNLATFYLALGNMDKVVAIGREVLDQAEAAGDDALQIEGHVILGPALAFTGNMAAGMVHLDRAIALWDPAHHGSVRLRLGPSSGVIALAVSALLQWLAGHVGEALRRAGAAVEAAEAIDHPYSLAYATFHAGLLDLWSGRVTDADRRASQVLALAEARDYQVWAAIGRVLLGVATGLQGRPDEGLAMAREGLAMYENLRTPPIFWAQVMGLKAQACAMAGRPDEAFAALDEGLRVAGDEPNFDAAALLLARGGLREASGDRDGAIADFRAAWAQAAPIGAPMVQLQAALRLVDLRAAGEPSPVEAVRSAYNAIALGEPPDELDRPDLEAARAILAG
jgi:predicted ATPase/class 3 adenylate cyclase